MWAVRQAAAEVLVLLGVNKSEEGQDSQQRLRSHKTSRPQPKSSEPTNVQAIEEKKNHRPTGPALLHLGAGSERVDSCRGFRLWDFRFGATESPQGL